MDETTRCPSCGGKVPQPKTGRPRIYCSGRCKKKGERRRDREANHRAMEQVQAEGYATPEALCHVCSRNPATVGTPHPILCASCAVPPGVTAG